MKDNTGGPAFTVQDLSKWQCPGMTLRDWFAATIGHPDIGGVSQCDDQDLLERYGTPEEIDEGFRMVLPEQPMVLRNVLLRQKLEARARAELRYLEADAMLAERSKE